MLLRDRNTIDLSQQKLRLADDLVVWPVHERGELVYRLEIPSLHQFFRVGNAEYLLISLLDGETTIPQACGLAAAKLGSRAPTASQAEEIQRWLLQNELAYLDSDGPPARVVASARRGGGGNEGNRQADGKLWNRLNPFWMKFPLPAADRWLVPLTEKLTGLFSVGMLGAAMTTILLAVIVLFFRWNSFSASASAVFTPAMACGFSRPGWASRWFTSWAMPWPASDWVAAFAKRESCSYCSRRWPTSM